MKCLKCGKLNDDNYRFCQYCGEPTERSVQNIRKVVDTPALIPESKMSTPSQNTVDAWFGLGDLDDDILDSSVVAQSHLDDIPSDLGKLIALAPKAEHKSSASLGNRFCLHCGEPVPKGHKFCGNCGAKYQSEQNLPRASESLHDLASEAVASKRKVERVNFVKEFVMPTGQEIANFTMFHVKDDGTLGEQIPLKAGENIIGKSSSSALKGDRFVSPKHLRIICHKDRAVIDDYGSLNGVFLRLSNSSYPLENGDSFRVGEEFLCYSEGKSKQKLLMIKKDDDTKLLGGKEPECWGYLQLILGPSSEGNVYRLESDEITLGRTHADILFPKDGFVSGLHAKLSKGKGHATLTDLDSSNGTFIKLRSPITVRECEHILIGNQLLRIKVVKEK